MSTDTKTTAAAAHTPGPWTSTHFPSSTECRHGIRANGDFFASIDAAHPRHAAEMEANARLIAAAPAMLSELRNALRWILTLDAELVAGSEMPDRLRAAIANATANP